MEDLTGSNRLPPRQTAVALGLFDGLHCGHRDVIRRAVDFKSEGFSPAIFTFETASVTSKGEGGVDVILPHDLKFELLDKMGVEYVYSPDFLNFRHLSADEFVQLVLRDKLRARYIICGRDFHFGRGGGSGIEELRTLTRLHRMEIIVIEPTIIDGSAVSSTRIRQHIRLGEIVEANRLLGYEFMLKLEVAHGNQIGRTIDFPTINQYLPSRQVVPRFGVYASHTVLDGKIYQSITNVGVKPTIIGVNAPSAETHIIGFSGDLYGQIITVELGQFIRPEQKFSGLDELKLHIKDDIKFIETVAEGR